MALTAAAAFLFYRSVWALLLGCVFVPCYLMKSAKKTRKENRRMLEKQFVSAMQMISGSLRAGYSLENAWRNAEIDMVRLYGVDAQFCVELRKMNQQLAMNEPLEKVFSEYAAECGVEDICNFAEVLRYARRGSGNLASVIGETTGRMQQKEEVLAEIENAVTAKKMEQKVMNLLMPGILLFVTVSSPSYAETLYHNMIGILIMSAALAGYCFCVWWSEKLVDIEV